MAYNTLSLYGGNKDAIEYITYEVQDGDTYESIANAHGITISELVILNDLSAYDLEVIYTGSILKVGKRSKITGNVIKTNITTDDDIEQAYIDSSRQTISVDTVTQARLESIKETYRETGTLDSITNDLNYIASRGYSTEEIQYLLNEYNIDVSGIDEDLLDKTLVKTANGTGGSYDDSDFTKDSILGLPFRYNTYSDPRKRVYNSTFMTDAPIVSIIPGKPLFRGAEDNEDKDLIDRLFGDVDENFMSLSDIIENTAKEFNLIDGAGYDDDILNWLKKSQKDNVNNGDLRYYRFKEDYDTFETFLDINLSTLAVKMGIGELGNARYKNFMNRNNDRDSFLGISRAYKFYCTKSGTSTSESISNEFGDSQLAGTANSISEALQEFNYLTGNSVKDFVSSAGSALGTALGSVVGSVAEIFGGNKNDGVADLKSQIGDAVSAAAGGNKLIWPQIWKNSTFSRQYSLSFEFVSPYGTPESIFRNVYLPFVTLLTLAMPKQYGTSGYGNPFLIRLDMPGHFTSDLAVIQSMSWRKGGNDNLFTNDGLPLAITVDITVQDLYPSMMMSESWAQLRHNTGMHSFLDNMAGLSVQRFTPWQNVKNAVGIKAINVLGNIERATIGAAKTKIYSVAQNALKDLFGSSLNQ